MDPDALKEIEAILADSPGYAENAKFFRELLDSSEAGFTEGMREFTDALMKQNGEEPSSEKEESSAQGKENQTKEATKDHRRILTRDRSADLEYYTTEELGPSRELTPEGFLICYDVPVARTGEMIYGPGETPIQTGRDGRVKVQRSAAEVFAPKSMASLAGKPVTDDHPPVDVAPDNWRFYTRGVIVNPRRGEGAHKDFLIADLIIFDAETIEDINAGKREVSAGYNPDYLEILDDNGNAIPGEGEQANIRYNHMALVSRGRCGPMCAIRDHKTVDTAFAEEFWSARRARRLSRLSKAFR